MVLHLCPSAKITTMIHDLITVELSLKEQANQQNLNEAFTL